MDRRFKLETLLIAMVCSFPLPLAATILLVNTLAL